MTSIDPKLERLFPGDSELAARMRAFDWSKTDLGLPEQWPDNLRVAVSLCLTSRIPIVMYWGRDFTVLYNDAYISFLGATKHPRYLGQPARECWQEIWETIGPMLESVYATGSATLSEDVRMFFARRLPLEEVYVRFTFGPILASDGKTVQGIFCPCTETTEQVVSARRLETHRKLGLRVAEMQVAEEACQEAAKVIAENPHDIPFAAIYLVDETGTRATMSASVGLPEDGCLLPWVVSADDDSSVLPLALVLRTQRPAECSNLETLVAQFPGEPRPDLTKQVLVLPISVATNEHLTGLFVAGVSHYLVLDTAYRTFFDLVTGFIGTAIANARAYEAERKRAEALAELDRAKTTFFSNISHEFRTPLTLILGPLKDTLSNSAGLNPSEREQLETVHRNSLRLLKLVNTLLDFSRLEAERVQAVYEPTDLAMLTADLAGVFRSAIERAGMRLVVHCSPLSRLVYVDRQMWEKIVLNLLSNAFKFTFEGEIAVTLCDCQDSIELEVRDTGTGIPADELPHIFERFHRVQGARGRTYEGSGIGLSLVQELVRLHGGTIQVSSVVDRGTSFTVSIPTGYAHLPSECINSTRTLTSTVTGATPYVEEVLRWLPEEEGQGSRGAGEQDFSSERTTRILLADDNADMRDYVKRLLSQQYEVEAVRDGVAALAAVRQQLPDLVLTDVMMPELDGFGLLRELRADPQTKELPIILLSARAGEESRIEGLEAGADDYLIKPFSARELLAQVEANLKLAQLRQESTRREQVHRREVETAKEQLESVLSGINDLFLVLDREWRYIYVNNRVVETVGIPKEALLGKSIWELFPDLVGSKFYTQVHRAIAEQTAVHFEYYYPAWNRWFENHAYPSSDGLTIFITEISDHKRAETALRESEARFRSFAENSNDVIWITSAHEYRLIYVSPSYDRVWGRLATEIYTDLTRFIEYVHPDDRQRIQTGWEQCIQGGFSQEYRVIRPDGSLVWIYDRGFPIYDDQGELLYLGGIAEDITKRKQAELMLVEQKKLLELIASGHPLDECLSAVCVSVSNLNPSTRACILLTDAQCRKFPHSIAPDFPPLFGEGLKDAPINDLCIGTCGEAVYSRQPITCADIANDNRWSKEWRDLCVAHGVLACHSVPVLGVDNQPLGSLMLCFKEARMPTDWEYQLATFGTQIASIVFERDRSSLALRESEERLRRVIEIETVGVIFFKTDGSITDANDAFLQMSGYSREDFEQGRVRWNEMTPPEWMPHSLRAIEEFQSTGYTTPYEKEYIRKDGSRWWALFAASRLSDGEGVELIVDINARKQAEDALRQREAELHLVTNAVPALISFVDSEQRYRFNNREYEEWFGHPETEIYGKHIREVLGETAYEEIRPYVEQVLAGQQVTFESQIPYKDGGTRYVRATYVPRFNSQGFVEGFVALVNDISDRKQAETEREQLLAREQAARAEAERANRVKDEFLAIVSHELRSPLNPILGWSTLLQTQTLDRAKTTQALSTIARNAKLQSELIEDLLDISRILRGKLSLNVCPVDLASTIQAAMETVRLAAQAKSIQIHTILEPEVGLVSGDSSRLQQVVWNLLSNAVKFTPSGGRVDIRLERLGSVAQITVSDTGKGIHPDFLPHVFDYFRQEDGATTRKFGGLGLGLAIVHHLVELHGGTVKAESPGEGQGAIFTVRLSLMQTSPEINQDSKPSEPALDLTGIQVLVVDDDADSREFVAFLIEQYGANVINVASAGEALVALTHSKPDVLLSDIGMPEVDGYMLMRQVRALPPEQGGQIPAIALTAYAGEINYRQAILAGFQRHIPKPVEPANLVYSIADLVRHRVISSPVNQST